MTMKKLKCINALQLKVLAMALMALDHAWATLAPDQLWLTAVGRLAFPIFAFQIAEGFRLTHDRKKYLKRLFLFALISEIPFNYMDSNGPLAPLHQNVLFTFCLAVLALMALERAKKKSTALYVVVLLALIPAAFLVGGFTFVDYAGYGIWMVMMFYVFRDVPFGWAGELAVMIYINWYAIGGLVYNVPIAGHVVEIPEQGLAVLALIPIWLYNGRQGPHSKAIQYACYAFYPVHIAVLVLLARLL